MSVSPPVLLWFFSGSPLVLGQNSLEALAPSTHPRVPGLLVDCVGEIERRGLSDVRHNMSSQLIGCWVWFLLEPFNESLQLFTYY